MKKLLTILLFCILTVGMTSVSSAKEWQFVTSNNEFGIFFDTQSLQKTDTTIYSVWTKHEYTEAAGKRTAIEYKYNRPISHMLQKMEFNYSTKQFKILTYTFYDKSSATIDYFTYPSPRWNTIIPDSMVEELFTASYNYYKKHYQ